MVQPCGRVGVPFGASVRRVFNIVSEAETLQSTGHDTAAAWVVEQLSEFLPCCEKAWRGPGHVEDSAGIKGTIHIHQIRARGNLLHTAAQIPDARMIAWQGFHSYAGV